MTFLDSLAVWPRLASPPALVSKYSDIRMNHNAWLIFWLEIEGVGEFFLYSGLSLSAPHSESLLPPPCRLQGAYEDWALTTTTGPEGCMG